MANLSRHSLVTACFHTLPLLWFAFTFRLFFIFLLRDSVLPFPIRTATWSHRNLVLNVLFMWKCHQHGPSSSSNCSLSPIHTTCFPAFFDFVLLLGACFMQLFFVLPRRTQILENLAQSVFVSRAMTKTGRRAVFVFMSMGMYSETLPVLHPFPLDTSENLHN